MFLMSRTHPLRKDVPMGSTSPVVRRTTHQLLNDLHRHQVLRVPDSGESDGHALHPMRPYDEQLAHERAAD